MLKLLLFKIKLSGYFQGELKHDGYRSYAYLKDQLPTMQTISFLIAYDQLDLNAFQVQCNSSGHFACALQRI